MIIEKRYDIEQDFTLPYLNGEEYGTFVKRGQLVSIDIIPDTYFFVCIDENDTDDKYCLVEAGYGILVYRGSGFNDAIEKGLERLKANIYVWDDIVDQYLDRLGRDEHDKTTFNQIKK